MAGNAPPTYTARERLRGLRGLVAAVIILGIVSVALAVLAASLWFSAGRGMSSGSSEEIDLPDTFGEYTTVDEAVRHYHWHRSERSYAKGYNAPAKVREYTRTDGSNLGATVIVVRAQLPSSPMPPVKPGEPESDRLSETVRNVSCVGHQEAERDLAEQCVKSTPLLSVELLPERAMPSEEAGALVEEVWGEVTR